MAHFYADIQGNRGTATRMGTPNSGINGHIRGWNIGAEVYCFVDENGNDCVRIAITSGSSGYNTEKTLGTWYKDKNGKLKEK